MKEAPLFAVCAVLALYALPPSDSSPTATSQDTAGRCRLPGPQDLVSRDGIVKFKSKQGAATIYEVPADKWFIVTDMHVEHSRGQKSAPPCLVESKGDKETVRICWPFLRRPCEVNLCAATSPLGNPRTGLAFPPGSKIVLSTKPFKPKPCDYYYHMRGYLAAADDRM